MQLGICADTATLALLSPAPGIDFIEGFTQELLQPETSEATRTKPAEALLAQGFSLPASNRFLPADLKVVGPDVDLARLDRFAETTFRRAKEINMTLVVFGSAGARMIPPGFSAATAFEQFVDVLRQIGPLAEENGVTLLVEPLNRGECNCINTILEGAEAVRRANTNGVKCNCINTILEGAEAVRRANTNGVKLLVDIFHMLRNGESADDIVKVAPLIRHAHIAENQDRAAPGIHGENFRGFFRALRRAHYHDRLTIEAAWTEFPQQVAPALAALRTQLRDSGY
ncbi:MAG: sugar phosphate isomerase/epimerase [Verrucomicrobia bacterium]|nr:sugar phosphate isomerase/epimerase [Verrucomicrobiota bacterium]